MIAQETALFCGVAVTADGGRSAVKVAAKPQKSAGQARAAESWEQ
jgi:hypothetical protein